MKFTPLRICLGLFCLGLGLSFCLFKGANFRVESKIRVEFFKKFRRFAFERYATVEGKKIRVEFLNQLQDGKEPFLSFPFGNFAKTYFLLLFASCFKPIITLSITITLLL